MINTITCNDCQEFWKQYCPYCKDKNANYYKSIIVEKKHILIKDEVVKIHNVFSNKFRILGKKGKCCYCEGYANTRDHFYPKSKGGVLTIHCCLDCNQQKADFTPTQWLMYIDHGYRGSTEKKELLKENTKRLILRTNGYCKD